MHQTPFKQFIITALQADKRLWNEDKTELNQTLLLDLVENIDETVIDLLLQEKDLREKFFVKIRDVYVFKTNDFRFFMEENKVDNSYTAYKNRIGLTDGKKFLKDTNDVVLDFPYKDCVLEGGQSTEEGTDTYFEFSEKASEYEKKQGKRKEIFFNFVLAHDEIDRLFDAKALTNWKRFTKDGEQEVKEIKRDEDGTIKENLIIKGNNLLALHSLKKQFAGKIKLIYIDPPYNTGSDSFAYNDNFNHSTWLTFMKNRLDIAKKMLSDDGTIAISIDQKEIIYLQVLCDEVFGINNRKNVITVKRSSVSGAKVINPGVVNISEYLVIYCKNPSLWKPNKVYRKKDRDERYNSYIINFEDSPENWKFSSVLDAWSISLGIEKSKLKKYFKDDYEQKIEEFYFANADRIFQFVTLDDNAVSDAVVKLKEKSKNDDNKVFILEREDKLNYYIYKGKALLFLGNRLLEIDGTKAFGEMITDIWDDVLPNDLHNEGGISLKKGKKPEKFIQRILQLTTKENDIILDFFSGSGTAGAVAHKMNRQYILIEQMDYIHDLPESRLKNVINGEQSGISKAVNWQGGGDFIYFELAKWNETAKEKILACENFDELIKFFDEMYERYFLNYNLKIKEFREKVIFEDEFKNLSLDEQKKMFVAMLDNNQMYVNKTEMEDKKFGIGKEDQKLTRGFYNI